MLPPEIAKRLDRLIAAHKFGAFTDEEFAARLGNLATADNVVALLEHFPQELVGTFKRGLALDDRRAADNECLRPEASPFESVTLFGRYFRNVAQALLEPETSRRHCVVSVVCLPSFQMEWAVRLLRPGKKGHVLVLTVAETRIWSSPTETPVSVRKLEVPFPADLAVLVGEVWRKMLLRVRHPEIGTWGVDGVQYHFACRGPSGDWLAGNTWTPEGQTAPGKLVSLSHILGQFAEQDEAARVRLSGEIRQIADWFERLA